VDLSKANDGILQVIEVVAETLGFSNSWIFRQRIDSGIGLVDRITGNRN